MIKLLADKELVNRSLFSILYYLKTYVYTYIHYVFDSLFYVHDSLSIRI